MPSSLITNVAPSKNVVTPIVLTIAGSDSGGGAGIQADIKAISATGSYACSAITALTAQNTKSVSAILPISSEFIEQQLDAIFTDLNVVAVKVGMLIDVDIITCVANKIRQYQPKHLVVDPVMVTRNGDLLLQPSAIAVLKSTLLPLADVITPNLFETAALLDSKVPENESDMLAIAKQFYSLGVNAVLLKGGALQQQNSTDLLVSFDNKTDAYTVESLSSARIRTNNTHGTGCSLSAAIASYLAQGYALQQAVRIAKQYITQALQHADTLQIGQGHGPINHFYALTNQCVCHEK